MSHAAPTAKPAAGPATRACGHAACRKTLMPPLLLCSKCKAEAYCCKACQVGTRPPPPRTARRRTRVRFFFLALTRSLPALPAPPAARPPRGRPDTNASAARRGRARPRRESRERRLRARRRG